MKDMTIEEARYLVAMWNDPREVGVSRDQFTRAEKVIKKWEVSQKVQTKAKKKVLCRVRGNNVTFYGELAEKVERAIKVSGLTPVQFLDNAIKHYCESQGLDVKKPMKRKD